MQKAAIYILSLTLMAYLGYQTYLLQKERASLAKEYDEEKKEYEELKVDSEQLKEDIEYFSDPHNLEKELRSKFNYRLPNEKLIIVVPGEEVAGETTGE
ncbi:MAG: hypothetical protein A2Y84_01120 [Candidatus Colwellbacteria bacterium RBG_13_48_8]|uniref:Cell division protein FtsL n=1 Tax=Candidatus Colwellbacteria bacterium RBG_13_48_8 TaxID=1797685 RepID=A0A1G1YVX7_9BACT|nr:MAG: hypothetical protein A2Y84_01120 [Candidatus Colwellbacteria bacterium RBG_13_48_8]